MSERYKFVEGYAHFITFAVVGWVDVFTRREYAEFLLQNLAYCRKNKGLWVARRTLCLGMRHELLG